MVGIYKITNPNGKVYIGLSKDVKKRWNSYKNYTGMKSNSLLKESFQYYGYDNHIFEVEEECDVSDLRKREKYWIKYYNSYNEGLNQNKGGCGPGSHTDETKKKISLANSKPKPLIFTEKIRKPRKNFPSGKDHGNYGKPSHRKGVNLSEETIKKISNSNKGNSYRRKIVLQYSIDGEFLRSFPSAKEAGEYVNGNGSQISLCCNGVIKTSYKYKWKYKE